MAWRHSLALGPFPRCFLSSAEIPAWAVDAVHQFCAWCLKWDCPSQLSLLDWSSRFFSLTEHLHVRCCFEANEDNLYSHEFASTSFFGVLGPISLYLWHFLTDCWTPCMKHYEQSQLCSSANLPLSTASHGCWRGGQCLDSLLPVTLTHLLAASYLSDSLKQITFFSFIKWLDTVWEIQASVS